MSGRMGGRLQCEFFRMLAFHIPEILFDVLHIVLDVARRTDDTSDADTFLFVVEGGQHNGNLSS